VKPRLLLLLVTLAATGGCGIPRWPVDAPLTSDFGLRFRGARPDLHRGVDLRVPTGTEVGAMAEGSVRFAGTMSGFGNVVWLDHGGTILTVYAHLSTIRVGEGQRVGRGQVVGLSGQSGDATAPHLHFEVWRGGHEVDPVPLLGGRPGP
jgi:murein DD-endopeptidase MepM/ murein hydrolase activator NlpD